VFACPQVELGTTPSAYQATNASGIAIDHPANDAGLVLEGQASNICLYSDDFANAAWTKGTGGIISNLFVAPDGNTVADNLIYDSVTPAIAKAEQTITVAASSTYTFSCWVRSPSGLAVPRVEIENAGTGVVYGTTTVNVETNWTRISCVGTTPAGVTSIKVRVSETTTTNVVVWGAQLELGTAATSYIPTTTASARREGDICGVLNPHNLALQSETQTNAAWSLTGWTIASTPIAGPVASLLNAYRITTTATSTDNIRQTVPIPGGSALKIYTFSVWLRQNATTASVSLHIENQLGTSRGNATATLSTAWQRFLITALMSAGDTDLIIKIRTANAAGTIDVFGAQVTEGYLPGRYIRITDTQLLPTTAIDPSWSQNGYIETDILWPAPSTIAANIYIFGDGTSTSAGSIIATINSSGSVIRFGRYDSTATLRNAQYGSASDIALQAAKMRFEWTNYTLAGTRYMFLRIYLNGVLNNEVNYAGTAGTSWPAIDVSRLWRARGASGDAGTWSNLTLGVPLLPQGAVPAGI
jgi:hypothetical protein